MINPLHLLKRIFSPAKQQAAPANPNFGVAVGEGTILGTPRRIEGQQYIHFGKNCLLGEASWIAAYDSYPFSGQRFTPEINIGDNVFIGSYATITCINKIILEEGVEIADFVYISDHMHSYTPEEGVPPRKRRLFSRGYVKIGAFTGIGIKSAILPGVTLGKYCLVGAHSVVTHSFPDYCLIMGNPAVAVKVYSPERKKWLDPAEAGVENKSRETVRSNAEIH